MSKVNIFLIILTICLFISVGILGKLAWSQHQLEQANSQLNEQLMEANLEIGKAETKFGKAKTQLEQELQDWINRYNEQIDAYGELEAKYSVATSGSASNIVYVTGTSIHTDKKDITPGIYLAQDSDEITLLKSGLKLNYSDHRLDLSAIASSKEYSVVDANFSYDLHLVFFGELIKTSTKSGAINYYFNLWEIGPDGEKLGKMELQSFTVTTIDERAPEFFWWAPHIDLSGYLGIGKSLSPEYGVAIGISAMGYGLTENDLQFRVLNLSMDIGTSIGLGFTPVQYNLGHHIPLISNLWIGPHIGINIDQEWYGGIVLGGVL